MTSYIGYKAHNMGFDAHLTVCYFGEDNPQEEYIRKYIENLNVRKQTSVLRESIDLFGPNYNIPVVRVTVDQDMLRLRAALEMFSVSQFIGWNPHITLDLGMFEIRIPELINLSDLGVY